MEIIQNNNNYWFNIITYPKILEYSIFIKNTTYCSDNNHI